MAEPASAPANVGGLGLLLRVKFRMLANRFDQASRNEPIKLITTLVFMALIWVGLYVLFAGTLQFVRQRLLESIVAVPLVFQFFFIALAIMLAFSNAIIVYGGLFGRGEAPYLLATPCHPCNIVTLKFLESLLFASWALLLLGLPLMTAMAQHAKAPWPFYPFFVGFFLFFVPIPAAVGLLAAWAAARLFPRARVRVLAVAGTVILLGGSAYLFWVTRETAGSALWLKNFFDHMQLIQKPLLPNHWIAEGIALASEGYYGKAGFYLFVLAANALFLSWLAVEWVSRGLSPAFATAQAAVGRPVLERLGGGWLTRLAEAPFFYLPQSLRRLARKDIRCFIRDPIQWSQTVILLGLLGLYVTQVRKLQIGLGSEAWLLLIALLNLIAVSLILATFTSRFVFPLISLEGQQFWLLNLLPLRRSRILWAKFAYAVTITLGAGLPVMGLSIASMDTSVPVAIGQLAVIAGVCIGLCGMAVGFGACWPMFEQRNAARIASGFGGTINLLLSVALVMLTLAGPTLVGVYAVKREIEITGSILAAGIAPVVAFDILAAIAAMTIGVRRFQHTEF